MSVPIRRPRPQTEPPCASHPFGFSCLRARLDRRLYLGRAGEGAHGGRVATRKGPARFGVSGPNSLLSLPSDSPLPEARVRDRPRARRPSWRAMRSAWRPPPYPRRAAGPPSRCRSRACPVRGQAIRATSALSEHPAQRLVRGHGLTLQPRRSPSRSAFRPRAREFHCPGAQRFGARPGLVLGQDGKAQLSGLRSASPR